MESMNRFQSSFRLLSESLAIVRSDRSLLLFPVLSILFTLVAVVLILVPGAVLAMAARGDGGPRLGLTIAAAMFWAGYAATAVATYFNVALVSCAAKNFHGEQTSVGQGLRAANGRIVAILVWSLIAALVGTLVRSVEQRAGMIGSIVASLLGAAWAVATYFVVPVLASPRRLGEVGEISGNTSPIDPRPLVVVEAVLRAAQQLADGLRFTKDFLHRGDPD
jgi:Family of unknown function (DUF6159)